MLRWDSPFKAHVGSTDRGGMVWDLGSGDLGPGFKFCVRYRENGPTGLFIWHADPGYRSRKFLSLQRINSTRETHGSLDSCNAIHVTSRLHVTQVNGWEFEHPGSLR